MSEMIGTGRTGGIEKGNDRDEKSKRRIDRNIKKLQSLVIDRLATQKFHGHLVLTVKFFDSAITGCEVETLEKDSE